MITYAQNQEDVMLARVFEGRPAGFYIDVGAMDPVEGSVTKHFYDLGWRGINIEPDPRFHARLQSERPRDLNLLAALGETAEARDFYLFEMQGLSTFNTDFARHFENQGYGCRIETQSLTTLQSICDAHVPGAIDFLKIDAEGWEGPIVRGADWERFRPSVLLLEATRPYSHEPYWTDWEPLLLDHGYLMVYFDGLNRFYVDSDKPEMADAFRFPPNVLDQAIPYAVIQLQQRNSELSAELQELRRQLEHAATPVDLEIS